MSRRRKKSKHQTSTGIGILSEEGTFIHEPTSEAALSEKTAVYLREHYPKIPFNIDVLAGINLSVQQGVRAKKQGKTKSWPDIFIAVARQGYHGLFIEQKKHGERIVQVNNQQKYASPHVAAQAEMLQRLRNEGYCAEFAVGFAETQEVIDWYLGEEKS